MVVRFPKPIEQLCWPKTAGSGAVGLDRLRDCQAFRAFVAGACVLRCHPGEDTPLTIELESNADDYDLAYSLLTSSVARPADQPLDRLAVLIVARGNAYLEMSYKKAKLRLARQEEGNTDAVRSRHMITRRELADLGERHSKAIRRLIAFLLRQKDGYKRFCGLGLEREVSEKDWQEAKAELEAQKQGEGKVPAPKAAKKLLSSLESWTGKKVRTRVNRLVRDELIVAERPKSNGPWQYTLPAELTTRSEFHNLPMPAMIRAELAAAGNVSALPAACPACPPSAHDTRQTEVEEEQPVTSQEDSIAPISEN